MRRLTVAALGLALGTGLLLTTLGSLRIPWSGGDFVSNWGLKSRALYRTGDLASIVRVDPANNFVRPNYPPLWPILLASASRVAGGWDPLRLTPLWPALSLLACLLAMRATRGDTPARLLAGAAIALLPYYRTALYGGYAEALLIVFVLAALGERDRLESSAAARARFALFIALAAATKQEGLVLAAVCVLLCTAARRFRLASLVAFGTALAAIPWAVFVRFHAEPEWRADFSVAAFGVGKLGRAAGFLLREAVVPNAGWILGAAVLVGVGYTKAPPARDPRSGRLPIPPLRLDGLHDLGPGVAPEMVLGPAGSRGGGRPDPGARGVCGGALRRRAVHVVPISWVTTGIRRRQRPRWPEGGIGRCQA